MLAPGPIWSLWRNSAARCPAVVITWQKAMEDLAAPSETTLLPEYEQSGSSSAPSTSTSKALPPSTTGSSSSTRHHPLQHGWETRPDV